MKKIICIVLLWGICLIYTRSLFAQSVGIGSSSFIPGAMLEIRGTGTSNATKALNVQNSTPSDLFTILNDGNVGINSNAPATKLDIVAATSTGTAIRLTAGSLSSGIGLDLTSAGTITGSLASFTANSLTTGKGLLITTNAITSGSGLGISSSSTAISSGSLLLLSSTGAIANASGSVLNVFSSGVNTNGYVATIVGNSATTGSILNVNGNALTSGSLVNATSSSTAFTGTLGLVSLTGSNAANTGTVFKVSNAGGANTGAAMMVSNSGSGLGLRVNDDGTDTDTSPFVVDGNGNVGVGTSSPVYQLQLGNLTSSSTASPVQVSLGGTYGSAAAGDVANMKQLLYDDGTSSNRYGLGISASLLELSSRADFGFFTGAVTARTQVMRITTGGLVGVGANTPTAYLDLPAATTSNASLRARTATGVPTSPNAGDFYSDGSNIWFYDGGAATWVDLTDNGATANVWSTTANYAHYNLTSSATFGVGIGDNNADALFEVSASAGAVDLMMLSSDDGSDGNRFVVKNGGNVGIGTTTPSQLLELGGTNPWMKMGGTTSNLIDFGTVGAAAPAASSVGARIRLWGTGAVDIAEYAIGIESNHMWFTHDQTAAASGYKFYNGAATETMRIQGDGNVGIGVSGSAARKLDVRGTIVGSLPCVAIAMTPDDDLSGDDGDVGGIIVASVPSTNHIWVKSVQDANNTSVDELETEGNWSGAWVDFGDPSSGGAGYPMDISVSLRARDTDADQFGAVIAVRWSTGVVYVITTDDDQRTDTDLDDLVDYGAWSSWTGPGM